MQRRALILAGLSSLAIPASADAQSLLDQGRQLLNQGNSGGTRGQGLSASDIAQGLKDALEKGSALAVSKLGKADGFLRDAAVHIKLPDTLARVQSVLQGLGAGSLGEDLEIRLNRAAEQATPAAKDLFVRAIRAMTVSDAQGILNGPADAATQYLRRTTGSELGAKLRPPIEAALKQAGAVSAYDSMMGRYRAIPGVPDLSANLADWTRDKGLDGIFHYVAAAEADIRANPAARTSELLRKVFG